MPKNTYFALYKIDFDGKLIPVRIEKNTIKKRNKYILDLKLLVDSGAIELADVYDLTGKIHLLPFVKEASTNLSTKIEVVFLINEKWEANYLAFTKGDAVIGVIQEFVAKKQAAKASAQPAQSQGKLVETLTFDDLPVPVYELDTNSANKGYLLDFKYLTNPPIDSILKEITELRFVLGGYKKGDSEIVIHLKEGFSWSTPSYTNSSVGSIISLVIDDVLSQTRSAQPAQSQGINAYDFFILYDGKKIPIAVERDILFDRNQYIIDFQPLLDSGAIEPDDLYAISDKIDPIAFVYLTSVIPRKNVTREISVVFISGAKWEDGFIGSTAGDAIADMIQYFVDNKQAMNASAQPAKSQASGNSTPNNTIIGQYEKDLQIVKKEISQLLVMKGFISPIDFETKIQLNQKLEDAQKRLNELNFKIVEAKLDKDDIFEDLFEQSFTPINTTYSDVYAETTFENEPASTNFFAPDGTPSKLSDALNELIRTPQFMDWFGNWQLAYAYKDEDAVDISCSKVVNEHYEPLLVWHGTGAQFSYFRFDNFPAAYFAVKYKYSKWFADLQGGANGGYTIPFFLNIRNPLDLTNFGTRKIRPKDFFDYMFIKTGMNMEELEVNPLFMDSNTPPLETWVFLRQNAKMLKKLSDNKVYDGIHFYETNPNVPEGQAEHSTEAFIIFNPNQCKIADPERGLLLFGSLKSFLLKKGGKI